MWMMWAAWAAEPRDLACERVVEATEGNEKTVLDAEKLGVQATEGAIVERVTSPFDETAHRIVVSQMFETARVTTDYWFRGVDLLCARSRTTTFNVMYSRSPQMPEGIGPAYRVDRWVFDSKRAVVEHTVRQGPGEDERHVELPEVVKVAGELSKLLAR